MPYRENVCVTQPFFKCDSYCCCEFKVNESTIEYIQEEKKKKREREKIPSSIYEGPPESAIITSVVCIMKLEGNGITAKFVDS